MGRVVVKNELSNPTQSTGTWNNDIPYCRLDSYLIAANSFFFLVFALWEIACLVWIEAPRAQLFEKWITLSTG